MLIPIATSNGIGDPFMKIIQSANLLSRTLVLGLIATVLPGCIDHSDSGDTTKQDINRQNGAADEIESQYSAMKGQFAGTFNGSNILLTLDVARQTASGSTLVPQPTLVGSLSLAPPVFVDNTGQPMLIPYIVASGQYVGGNDLSLVVTANGNPTTVHCMVSNQSDLDCNWYLNSTAPRASFTLRRIQDGQIPVPTARDFSGVYRGGNKDFAMIEAGFRTFLEPQNGSLGIPQLTIVGSFTFAPRRTPDQIRNQVDPGKANFPFVDSQYDPITSTIAIKISGDNPIQVNCTVASSTTLRCSWIGTHGDESYENFDLVKVN